MKLDLFSILVFPFFVFFIIHCTVENGSISTKEKIRYRQDRQAVKIYPCFEYFPMEIPQSANSIENYSVYSDKKKGVSWQVAFSLSNAEIKGLIAKFKSSAVKVVSPREKSLGINFRFAADTSLFNVLKSLKEEEGLYPIPHFYIGTYSDLKGTLSDDFLIYILEAKAEKNIDTGWQENFNSGVAVSEKWEYGCSSGVAISEKQNRIIYWGEIW